MSISNFRALEPWYIVILRDRNSEHLLKEWARLANAQVIIENNKMKLYEERSFVLFQLKWPGTFDDVTVWDCWNRRHIYLA